MSQSFPNKNNLQEIGVNSIDALKTNADVEAFIKEQIHSSLPILVSRPQPGSVYQKALDSIYQYYFDSLNVPSFFKADLNGNGKTDLLVNGFYRKSSAVLIFMAQPGGRFNSQIHLQDFKDRDEILFLVPDTTGNEFRLNAFQINTRERVKAFFRPGDEDYNPSNLIKTKKLVFRFGKFIEQNEQAGRFPFTQLTYTQGGFYEGAIRFELMIDSVGNCLLNVFPGDNKSSGKDSGLYSARLGKEELIYLQEFLGYVDLKKLDELYQVKMTHPPYGILWIKDLEGNELRIIDRGLSGTFGLDALHLYFRNLLKTLDWKRIEPEITKSTDVLLSD